MMTEKDAKDFTANLCQQIEVFLHESPTRVSMTCKDSGESTSIVLRRRPTLGGPLSNQTAPSDGTLETHIFLDNLHNELDVWHSELVHIEGQAWVPNAQYQNGTKVERFVVPDKSAIAGYRVKKDGEMIYLDRLVRRICKPICETPGT